MLFGSSQLPVPRAREMTETEINVPSLSTIVHYSRMCRAFASTMFRESHIQHAHRESVASSPDAMLLVCLLVATLVESCHGAYGVAGVTTPLGARRPHLQLSTEPISLSAAKNLHNSERFSCPTGWNVHGPGFWSNPAGSGLSPCGANSTSCREDTVNITAELCARKCAGIANCLAFEVYSPQPSPACFVFVDTLKLPFHPDPDCQVCVKSGTPVPPSPPPPSPTPPPHRGYVEPRSRANAPRDQIKKLNGSGHWPLQAG